MHAPPELHDAQRQQGPPRGLGDDGRDLEAQKGRARRRAPRPRAHQYHSPPEERPALHGGDAAPGRLGLGRPVAERRRAEPLEAEHDLEEYAEAIAKYQQAAEEIENKCTDSVRTGLFSIECSECKQVLSEAASNITNGLLTQIRQSVYDDNKMICESYATMSVDVAKVCTTSEDVLELKARIQKCTADQEQLLEVIKESKLQINIQYSSLAR